MIMHSPASTARARGFVHVEPTVGGWGAWEGSDGESALINNVNAGSRTSRSRCSRPEPAADRALRDPARLGGPGEWRGGNGVVREFEVECDEAWVALVRALEDTRVGPVRRRGRDAAGPGDQPGPRRRAPRAQGDGLVLARGDVIRGLSGGGGGFGEAAERDPELVRADLRDGQITTPRRGSATRRRGCPVRSW